jgi:hypothetical protein
MLKVIHLVQMFMDWHIGSIHNWGTKNECLIEKGVQKTTLDFHLFYIIIIVVDFYMPIDIMMSS